MSSNQFWWTFEKGQIHKGVFETIEHLKTKQSSRSEDNVRNLRLYGNSEVLGLRWGDYSIVKNLSKLTLNVIQSAVDTATARIAKTKPKPMFLTEDGDFTTIRKAQNLEAYIGGCFYNMDFYEKAQTIFRDAGVWGDGMVKFYEEEGEIKCERVLPEEIMVDEDECIYGEDSQKTIHQIKYVSKEVLKAKYKNKNHLIDSASTGGEHYMKSKLTPDMAMVVESWKLSDGGKTKGKHTLCISNCTLFEEDYAQDFFPFEKWGWNPRLLGYWSQGIAEILTGIQIEMNKTLKTYQISLHLGAVPKVFIEDGSKISSNHINNEIGAIIKYRGTMPTEGTLMRIPPELMQTILFLYDKAFQQIGLSTMSAQSEKLVGLDSGKALRTFHEIESERFAVTAQRWENFYMKCAKKVVKMSKNVAEKYPDMKVKTLDSKRMKVIKWKDVDLEEDSFVMKMYPTNLLADNPSSKLQEVRELMEVGLINKRTASSLLDFPDIESAMSLQNSIVEDIRATIEDIVDEGLYNPPEPFQDLEYAIPQIQSAYLKYKRSNLDIERLELFTRWIEDAMMLLSPPAAENTGFEDAPEAEDQEVMPEDLEAVPEGMEEELEGGDPEQMIQQMMDEEEANQGQF